MQPSIANKKTPSFEQWICQISDIHMNKDSAILTHTHGMGGVKEVISYDNDQYGLIDVYNDIIKKINDGEITAGAFGYDWNDIRFRGHMFSHFGGKTIALRPIMLVAPYLSDSNIDQKQVMDIISPTGLTLFCGPTGAGKSSTMTMCINELAKEKNLGICVKLEDPIEHIHVDNDFIFHRQIKTDGIDTFEDGVYEAVRERIDTIAIGEIRDPSAAHAAVWAGMIGHRAMATIHGNDIVDAITQMFAFMDDERDDMLPQALSGVMAQRLLRLENRDRAFVIYETLKVDNQVKQVLKLGPKGLNQLEEHMRRQSKMTLRQSAQNLLKRNAITKKELEEMLGEDENDYL